ncbi:MAG: YkgJ family cysteine cluster protein [Alphaproteobacteria bacterium]|nr:YkgJ family cysteine cluster protein [Alphaproteobacteria bacterium]
MSLEDEIEQAVANAAVEAMAGGNEAERLSDLFMLLEETAQGLLDRHRQMAAPPPPFHCKEGCTHCCHTKHILLTPPEALLLLGMIEMCGFRFAVTLAARSARPGCPLLDHAGNCRFYAHRPLMCRAFHSLDVEACKKGVGEDGLDVPIWPPHFEIYTHIQAGLARGMMEKGLSLPKLDLRKVLGMEASSRLLWEQWLRGENPFEAAMMD